VTRSRSKCAARCCASSPVTCPDGTNTCTQLFWRVTDYHLETRESEADEWYAVPGATAHDRAGCESQVFYRLRRTVPVD